MDTIMKKQKPVTLKKIMVLFLIPVVFSSVVQSLGQVIGTIVSQKALSLSHYGVI
ncbi:hypothetical protein ACQKMN_18205 [Ureibacillus composti]